MVGAAPAGTGSKGIVMSEVDRARQRTQAGMAMAVSGLMMAHQAAHTIGRGAPLLRYFGLYYTVTSLLTFLMQTFLTRISIK